MTNTEGTGPPRVLITGGLGQLGSGLKCSGRYTQRHTYLIIRLLNAQ